MSKLKFYSKIEILFKNRNFVQKSKFYSKIEILFKNRYFDQNKYTILPVTRSPESSETKNILGNFKVMVLGIHLKCLKKF